MVAEIEGVELNLRFDEAKESEGSKGFGVYHELRKVPESQDR